MLVLSLAELLPTGDGRRTAEPLRRAAMVDGDLAPLNPRSHKGYH